MQAEEQTKSNHHSQTETIKKKKTAPGVEKAEE